MAKKKKKKLHPRELDAKISKLMGNKVKWVKVLDSWELKKNNKMVPIFCTEPVIVEEGVTAYLEYVIGAGVDKQVSVLNAVPKYSTSFDAARELLYDLSGSGVCLRFKNLMRLTKGGDKRMVRASCEVGDPGAKEVWHTCEMEDGIDNTERAMCKAIAEVYLKVMGK